MSDHIIPHLLGSRPHRITVVVDQRMSIVHLKKLLPFQFFQVFRRHRPAEIGMVEMRDDGLPGPAALLQDGIDVVLHNVGDAVASLRLDAFLYVGGVYMDGLAFKAVGYFFRLQDQEASCFFKKQPSSTLGCQEPEMSCGSPQVLEWRR